MGLFSSKTKVELYEQDFNTKRMENREIFHEINVRSQDPELLRTDIVELIEDMDYNIVINKFTKFEDAEFENIFRAGRLKPLRAVLFAEKKVEKGSYFSFLWKFFFGLSISFFVFYLIPQSFFNSFGVTVSKQYLPMLSVLSLILSLAFWYVRKVDKLRIWIKASGIYDIESNKSDFRILLSGASTSRDSLRDLEQDLTEIFTEISRRYVKKAKKPLFSISKKKDVDIIKEINEVESELRNLDSRFANGEISEKVYLEVKDNLKSRKMKLETILDLMNT